MVFDGRGDPLPPRDRPCPADWSNNALTGSCLGHSTVLMNFFGVRVITDPVFSKRVGLGIAPFVLGPKRYLKPAVQLREIPPPDVIVISHSHFDHLDRPSLRKFSRDTPVITARGTADLLKHFRVVHELGWGESITLTVRGRPFQVSAIEVAHWGARMIRDEHRGYNGYLLERNGHRVCFAGDTACTPAFAQLKSQSPDLMLMPIGAYDPGFGRTVVRSKLSRWRTTQAESILSRSITRHSNSARSRWMSRHGGSSQRSRVNRSDFSPSTSVKPSASQHREALTGICSIRNLW
ncbi:MAG: MBL fold metallo-hydrolase [Opitutaceae bacterium]